ncbi:heme o synthase [Aquibacillus kalidii]|uniref:heme o synthase n=1 Tax=Aquibacillus kalidii TaxID=2762597 RepID=UPI001648D077|nr:heme o synthase [Aquibacillus kalidii]
MENSLYSSTTNEKQRTSFIADLKSLFKALVLVSNVLPVFTGFWLALYYSDTVLKDNLNVLFLTVIGSTLLMAGALLLNNWYDADIDAVMERTKNRPTVTGTISLKVVLKMGIIFSIVGFVLLLLTTIEAAVYGGIGWFTYVVLYTMWSKRRYTLNTIIGSISGAVTPLIGWAAVQPAAHLVPIVLFLLLFIWQVPHTFAIAMKKCEEYRRAGVAMLPVVHGFRFTKRQMVIYVACLLPLPFMLGSLGVPFVILVSVLNIGWLLLSIKGFFIKEDIKWAHWMFLYSLNYLMIVFFAMIIVSSF